MKKPLALLGALPLVLLLAACGNSAKGNDDTTNVVASFYPFAYVAEQVGGSHVKVSNLTAPGMEPHDLELKPKQVGDVQNADLVIYEKHFQAAVDDAVKQAGRSTKDTVDVATVVKLKQLQPGAAEEGHDHSDEDPHTWLDPQNMVAVTKAVEAKLSAVDPDHASDYAANASKLEGELETLGTDFATGLKTCKNRTIVTSHAAFQYLADRYDLTQVPIAGIDPANEPSPAQLADITDLVRKDKITTIFTEELVSPAIADTIANEAGVRTATLDPIEGLSDATKDQTYLTLMRKNLETLRKANSCS
ncbi:metal ABC transporter substrate-binding protein [Aeromicrobium ginsengisoli]|uniref:Zinc ABC transporter substrate-binding protein n=1 Tax=Aeromicrobium ginsengisoli TaxID=363867 RepID=A0A5M4FFL4_9ACTN|nr:metal ABC transporter substrate-binding protein [Aeromicrobium ginsengisoli]KAA1398009.1 zinc ABC transporter substrate-binding protein [Aeromicrobium ginsengisoli]